MRKRLRKKLFLREFQELGFDLKAKMNLPDEAALDAFWTKFVEQVEANNVHCHGAFGNEEFDMFVMVGQTGPDAEERKTKFIEWLKTQPEVSELTAGELVDAFYDETCRGKTCCCCD
ncbi:MAG: 50S ribosome-binding protein YggL [Lentisphaerota bacterium]